MIETCGSYRRLKSSCGDIDMLMTFRDGKRHVHDTALTPLIDKLKEISKYESFLVMTSLDLERVVSDVYFQVFSPTI